MIEPASAAPPEVDRGHLRARAHYRAALDALRAGDWSGFGREMTTLDKTLEQYERMSERSAHRSNR